MPPDPSFEKLLDHVRTARGFDFTGYKRPSLMRRVEKRMQVVKASSWDDYRLRLDDDGTEFNALFDTILINVTSFFRDPEAWQFVAEDVIPRILEHKSPRSPIRIWSAGCASGEEPFTIAMLFAEALGDDQLKERVKIYATDVDEEALTQARHAVYTEKQLAGVSDELRERYFTGSNHKLSFRSDLRRVVIFGRNDLMQDPPISRVDLLVSRNTLMYFNAPAQQRILANFFFALARRGFLMMGKAEALQSRTELFQAFDLKRRIFVKNTGLEVEPKRAPPPVEDVEPGDEPTPTAEPAFEQASLAQIVIEVTGHVIAINHAARAMFGLKSRDVGRPLQDLEISYRPLELRSLIDQTFAERRPVSVKEVEWFHGGEQRFLDVHLVPLVSSTGELIGVAITFTDITRYRGLQEELERARRDLETAYEELQSTVEELETTNEELQSTNEELETTNEELQSTNEELETMNEELQSTNEELETMNDELRDRTDDALGANAFLGSILSSIPQSVIVVDPQFRVLAWSRATAELWGLRADEVEGQNFLNLDIGVPVADFREPIREALAGREALPLALAGHDRRGRPIHCTVQFMQLTTHLDDIEGVILVVTTEADS